MKRICFGIYDREAGYARRLGSYLRRRCKDALEIKVFTKREALVACLEERGLQFILAGEDAEEICRNYGEVWFAVLSEEGENGSRDSAFHIAKYQSAEMIWKWILKLAGDSLSGEALLTDNGTEAEFLGICSPVHGCGKTILGLVMSRILAGRENNRILFLTLDEFSSLPALTGGEQEEPELSELFYYYSQEQLTKSRFQAALCKWGEADYILPARIPEDLYPEGKPYEADFLKRLAILGEYSQVVLDVGNSVWGKEGILRLCTRIYVPERENACDEMRVGRFQEWMRQMGLEGRCFRFRLPEEREEVWNRHDGANRVFSGRIGCLAREVLERSGYDLGEGK